MKKIILPLCGVLSLLAGWFYHYWSIEQEAKCLFMRHKKCITCDTEETFPVGYQKECTRCQERQASYMEEGLFPAWQCSLKKSTEETQTFSFASISGAKCPSKRPLKDILGNCYACDAIVPIKLAHPDKNNICYHQRYILPDQLFIKSMKCPDLESIQDAEVCIACGGVVGDGHCSKEGKNHFCKNADECGQNEWCYPFKIAYEQHQGVCVIKSELKWICSETDGYDLARTKAFCMAQKAHIPTLEEIQNADEDLNDRCPTLDVWIFFSPDGAVWLDSFMQEFLFTREGESQKLGGHAFHALCHKD